MCSACSELPSINGSLGTWSKYWIRCREQLLRRRKDIETSVFDSSVSFVSWNLCASIFRKSPMVCACCVCVRVVCLCPLLRSDTIHQAGNWLFLFFPKKTMLKCAQVHAVEQDRITSRSEASSPLFTDVIKWQVAFWLQQHRNKFGLPCRIFLGVCGPFCVSNLCRRYQWWYPGYSASKCVHLFELPAVESTLFWKHKASLFHREPSGWCGAAKKRTSEWMWKLLGLRVFAQA